LTPPPSPPVDEGHVKSRVGELAHAQGGRVRDLRKQKGLTIEDLAQRSGLHFNTVGRIERGVSDPSLEQLYVIALALGVDPAEFNPFPAGKAGAPSSGLDDELFVLIDLLDVQVSAGNGAFNGSQENMGRFAFSRSWMTRKGVKPASARIVHARGDSMADKINDGDILLVDTAIRSLEQDGVYVIQLDGHDYVKVLQRDFSTGGLQIISYNPAYKPQMLSAEQAADLRISGRVVWHGGEI
jgi:phage repressor protein C with HTH and peptisase S24 domain